MSDFKQLSDDLAKAGYHPFHAPCGILLNEANVPYSTCVRYGDCGGFPCPLHASAVNPALAATANAIRVATGSLTGWVNGRRGSVRCCTSGW